METEDISMKFISLTISSVFFLLMLSLLEAGEKPVEKSFFLSVNPNIKNEELKSELEVLKQNFDFEKGKIRDYYTKEIERMKEERRSEMKALKKQFAGQREGLLKKYGEDRKLNRSKLKESNPSDKKPIRKPK